MTRLSSTRGLQKRHHLAGASIIAMAALFGIEQGSIAPPAQAADVAQGIALEEIVVTARKREENLMTVPLAITAFTANDIENLGIKSIQDISAFTPSFHFNQETGGGSGRNDRSSRLLVFRGMSIAGGILFIDGAQVQGNTPPPIADVERIEILSGPQSAYFGRSTFMGALNYVMREPGDEFSGRFNAEVGSYGSNEAGLAVEGPLFANVTARLSLQHTYVGGQYDNAGNRTEEFGSQQTDSVSLSIVAHPSDSLSVKVWGTFYEDNDGPPAQFAFKTAEMNCNLGGTRGRYWCGALPDVSEVDESLISGNYDMTPYMYQEIIGNRMGFYSVFDRTFSTDGGIRRQAWQADARIEYETNGGYTFTSLTSTHRNKTQTILDLVFRDGRDLRNPYFQGGCGTLCNLAALPYPTWLLMSQNKSSDFNQEFRITSPQDGRLRWLAGANYLRQSSGGNLYGVKTNGTASSSTPARAHPVTPSLFGGVYYDITPQLTATAEARYQWDKVKNDVIGASTGFLLATPALFSATFKSFSPRVILDYKYNDNSTVYVLFARGFRPGGFNSALATQPAAVVSQFTSVGVNATFDEEKIDNYEVGWKSTWLDGRARTTLAIYKANWRDGQISTSVPFTTTTGQLNLLSVTQNLGAVDLWGGEFEGDFRVSEELTLSASLSLNNSEIKVFTCGDCLSIYGNNQATGNRLGQAEKWKGSLSADYRAPLAGDYDWFTRVDFSFRSKYFLDAANVSWTRPQKLVNIRLGVATQSVQIVGYVKNLFNDDGLRGHLGLDILTLTPTNSNLQNELRLALPDKRTFGIRASYDF